MSQKLSLSHLLKKDRFPRVKNSDEYRERLHTLQLEMLTIQQGLWNTRARAIVVLEGFDAAGKGGTIQRITERLDPRGVKVHPIGPPLPDEQARHYLYRFWMRLPLPGQIAIFDRSWYGRVLVERVDGLIPKSAWKRAYGEINEFEAMLVNDGVSIFKFFLGMSKAEQYRRLEARLTDPAKLWKISEADVRARHEWNKYVEAVDDMFDATHTKLAPWHLIAGDDKDYARRTVLEVLTSELRHHGKWMRKELESRKQTSLAKELKKSLR
ncbi:MAG: hypothetical protein JST16_17065 [Bdellovibrionales bacterium]|nr:hypothetical protein [Bdellovibrionales bacterium]